MLSTEGINPMGAGLQEPVAICWPFVRGTPGRVSAQWLIKLLLEVKDGDWPKTGGFWPSSSNDLQSTESSRRSWVWRFTGVAEGAALETAEALTLADAPRLATGTLLAPALALALAIPLALAEIAEELLPPLFPNRLRPPPNPPRKPLFWRRVGCAAAALTRATSMNRVVFIVRKVNESSDKRIVKDAGSVSKED